jgi:ribosome-binding factor A
MGRRQSAAGRSGGPSQRQLRAGELVRHALADVLTREEIHDPELAGRSITVSEVRMSPDLKVATCFVLPLGGAQSGMVVRALDRVAPWLAAQVSRRITLKFTPRLRFRLDDSFDEAEHIEHLLHRADVARDLQHDDEDEDVEGGSGHGA